MGKAWYFNTTGDEDKWYIRIYEVEVSDPESPHFAPASKSVKFTKQIVDSSERSISIGNAFEVGPSLIWARKLPMVKHIIDYMFTEEVDWVI